VLSDLLTGLVYEACSREHDTLNEDGFWVYFEL